MLARDFSDFMTAAALEDPPESDALGPEVQLPEVLALGPSALDLDSRARQGIEFLVERNRTEFMLPALATDSPEALGELWSNVGASVLRRMDAIAELLHEAARVSDRAPVPPRPEQVAVAELSRGFADDHLGDRVRRASALLADARTRMRELIDEAQEIDLSLRKAFHRAVLIWAVGIGLCIEITKHEAGPLEQPLRPGVLADAVELVVSGARLAGYYAAESAGLRIADLDSPDDLRPLLTNDDAVAFLVHASRKIPEVFGPDVRTRLELFRYPDAPEEHQFHVIIDSPLPRPEVSDRLDALCENWWDAAAAELGVDLYPVLGVIDDG